MVTCSCFVNLFYISTSPQKVLWVTKQSNDPCGGHSLVSESRTSLWCKKLRGKSYINCSSEILNGLIPGWGGYLGSGLHPGRAPAPRSFLGRRLRSRSAVKDLPGLSLFVWLLAVTLLLRRWAPPMKRAGLTSPPSLTSSSSSTSRAHLSGK